MISAFIRQHPGRVLLLIALWFMIALTVGHAFGADATTPPAQHAARPPREAAIEQPVIDHGLLSVGAFIAGIGATIGIVWTAGRKYERILGRISRMERHALRNGRQRRLRRNELREEESRGRDDEEHQDEGDEED